MAFGTIFPPEVICPFGGVSSVSKKQNIFLFGPEELKGLGSEFRAYQERGLGEPSLLEETRPKGCPLGVKGEPEADGSASNHSALQDEVGDSVLLVTQTSGRHR